MFKSVITIGKNLGALAGVKGRNYEQEAVAHQEQVLFAEIDRAFGSALEVGGCPMPAITAVETILTDATALKERKDDEQTRCIDLPRAKAAAGLLIAFANNPDDIIGKSAN